MTRISPEYEGETRIPKYAMYGDTRYVVTEICGGMVKCDEFYIPRNASVLWRKRKMASDLMPTNEEITSLIIPSSVKTIGKYAFCKLNEMENLTLSEGIEVIDEEAFRYCYKLKSLVLPNGLTEICFRAFEGCGALQSLDVPDTLTKIGSYAFKNCYNLKKLDIPGSVAEIGHEAFYSCKELKTLTIGDGVKKISERAFFVDGGSDNSLTKLVIPSSVEVIGVNAFEGHNKLESVDIYNDEEEVIISGGAFPATTKVNFLGKKAAPKPKVVKKDNSDIEKAKAEAEAAKAELETLKKTKIESEVAKEKVATKTDGEVDTDALWADVISKLKGINSRISTPKGRPYFYIASNTHKGSVTYMIGYSSRANSAWVSIESYGGEAARDAIKAMIANVPKNNIVSKAELKQGTRNKSRWALTVTESAEKPIDEVVKWYAESIMDFYAFVEKATPIKVNSTATEEEIESEIAEEMGGFKGFFKKLFR